MHTNSTVENKNKSDNHFMAATSEKKSIGSFYTPLDVAYDLVKTLNLFDGATILEPSCGDGAFIKALIIRANELEIGLKIFGRDIDTDALATAKIEIDEILGEMNGSKIEYTLSCVSVENASKDATKFDFVVGNPPYLESKRMTQDQKKILKKEFPETATASFDLFFVFWEMALRCLKKNGTIAYIVPNRVLSNAAAGKLRNLMLDKGYVKIIDLTDMDIFEASVYPLWVVLSTKPMTYKYEVTTLQEGRIIGLIGDAAKKLKRMSWPLPQTTEIGSVIRDLFDSTSSKPIGDLFDIEWAISFHAAGGATRMITQDKNGEVAPILGAGNYSGNREVMPYEIVWAGNYIKTNQKLLDSENVDNLDSFEGPKLVICQNAKRCRAAIDTNNFVLKDTFVYAKQKGEDIDQLYWLAILLNSKTFHVIYSALNQGTKKMGGFLQFIKHLLAPVQIPKFVAPDFEISDEAGNPMRLLTAEAIYSALQKKSIKEGSPAMEALEDHIIKLYGFKRQIAINALKEAEVPSHY